MHPHLHLLVPSSSRNVLLEVRLYLSSVSPSIAGFSVRARSAPVRYDSADFGKLVTGVKHVIVASHPWGRLGGNMLFPLVLFCSFPLSAGPPEAVLKLPKAQLEGDLTTVSCRIISSKQFSVTDIHGPTPHRRLPQRRRTDTVNHRLRPTPRRAGVRQRWLPSMSAAWVIPKDGSHGLELARTTLRLSSDGR